MTVQAVVDQVEGHSRLVDRQPKKNFCRSPNLLRVRGTTSVRMSLELDPSGRSNHASISYRFSVSGHLRSWKMALFDIPHTTSCQSVIVSSILYHFDIFDVEEYRDLKI